MAKSPNKSTTAEGEDDLADVSKAELNKVDADRSSGSKGPKSAKPDKAAFKGTQDPTKHPDWTTFRRDVENTAAGDLNMDPREPYPTGNPPDPEAEFVKIHGRRPGPNNEPKIAGVRDEPKPNEGT